jgi:signal transduction histidine kinase
MKHLDFITISLRNARMLPLWLLNLSRGQRLLLLLLSYGIGIVGLWFLFPLANNGASMFLPIICACWFFRYRGLFLSLLLNGLAFQFVYLVHIRGLLPDQAFMIGGLLGFGSSLALGLAVCWLRTAIDLIAAARQQTILLEQERFQALQAERQAKLAYEYQSRLNAHKDDFLLLVSHEFRTPLTVLGGTLDLLREADGHLSLREQARLLEQAFEAQEELAQLVERVLDATTVMGDLPPTESEVISLQELVQDVLGHLDTEAIAAYEVHIQVPEHVQVLADPQYLRQVLRNLFSNVFKYVPIRTRLVIEAVQPEPSAPVCLSIQDTGPGIPPEEAPLLFEKFVRLKRDMTGSKRGTGLGLYLCKRFLEAMGGQIWVESSGLPGEGSRFCIHLRSAPPFQG